SKEQFNCQENPRPDRISDSKSIFLLIYLLINQATNRKQTSSHPIDDRRSHRQTKQMHSAPRRTDVPRRSRYSASERLSAMFEGGTEGIPEQATRGFRERERGFDEF
ncbi:MAG: hypothetical protein ABI262_01050, partial [Microcoleus sp.]